MDNNNIFDEFGNVISDDEQIKEEKDLFEIEEVEDEVSNQQSKQNGNFDFHVEDQIEEDRDLYEDQQDFENQQDIYEEGEYMYQEEDEQDLDQPIIQMIEKQSYFFEQKIPQNFEEQFFCQLVQQEKDFRNTGLFGDFQSGKTKMLDVLIQHQTNSEFLHNQKNQSDFWKIEKDKKMTIFSKPVNIITEGSDEKNYLLTVFDTPGHTDLYDETFCIMESVDSAIFVIDVIQGLTMHANTILSDLLKQEIPIFFVLNKMDRFIQEMRLLPEDQYMIIEQIIYQIEQFGADLNKNVFFSSFKYGYLFSLKDFYEIYFNNIIETDFYSDLLFGECFWDQQLQQFDSQKKPQNERTFVQFILNPLYKIFSVLISQNVNELQPFLDELSIQIELDILQKLELKKLIKKIYQQKFCFVKSLFNIIILDTPVSSVRNEKLIKQNVNTTTDIQFLENDIILQLIKYEPLFQKDENTIHYFNIYARILNGKVIQNYSQVNNQQIQNIYGCVIGDQKLKLQKAYSGNIVLLENVDFDLQQKIICSKNFTRNYISNARNGSFVKVSLEPFQPNGMNIFKRSLNKLKKLMLGLIVNIQDTGEHQLQGRGETQLDIAMYFMREVLEIQEVRISDPYVQFAESITQISQIMPEVKTIDQKSSFQFLAEPIQDIYIENFEKLKNLNEQERKSKLKNDLKIDQFTINSLWCLSKDKDHPTLFFEQSLLPRKNKQEIAKYKDIIVQGFQWATNKGPLCQAPIRDCEFKLINFDINEAQLQASQIIPTIQKGIHSAMLLAQPCLKEPIYKFQIMTIKEALSTIYEIISKRRGQIFEEYQVPGFGYMILNGQVPILDSFGLETDIKAQSLGQAQISKIFYKWDIVPGDPLNQKAKIRKLEPSEPMSLARDILLKTRRKQGLTDEISLIKYFNDEKDIINLVDN